jgi:hypothetical protein
VFEKSLSEPIEGGGEVNEGEGSSGKFAVAGGDMAVCFDPGQEVARPVTRSTVTAMHSSRLAAKAGNRIAQTGFPLPADHMPAVRPFLSSLAALYMAGSGFAQNPPSAVIPQPAGLEARPYLIFDQATLEASKLTSLDEFLQQRVGMLPAYGPSVAPPVIFDQSTTGVVRREEYEKIRVGAARPPERKSATPLLVILFDGRKPVRLPALADVPLAAIGRIELLPTTAAGGVINVVVRSDAAGTAFRQRLAQPVP